MTDEKLVQSPEDIYEEMYEGMYEGVHEDHVCPRCSSP